MWYNFAFKLLAKGYVMTFKYLELRDSKYDERMAAEEAARCLLCVDAPCAKACPSATNPEQFISAMRAGDISAAAKIIRDSNVCGGACSLVCPADKLCEGACVRTAMDRPVAIRKLQQFVVEQEQSLQLQVLDKTPVIHAAKVACIGAGPASLTVAAKLAQAGYQVDIYEAMPQAGGMMSYGIPPVRLNQELVDWDVKTVTDLGVKIKLNTKIGVDISLAQLEEEYKAIFIGVGLWSGRTAQLGERNLSGVISAVDFLVAARGSQGKDVVIPKSVAVIGAGDTGMDCAATAKLLGAENVTVFCRGAKVPAYHEELKFVQSLGINVATQFSPQQFLGDDAVHGIIAQHADGYSELKLKAELVIYAIGQNIDTGEAFAGVAIEGNKIITQDFQTSKAHIFAAGDATNGGSTVVQAVKEAKLAASAMLKFLDEE